MKNNIFNLDPLVVGSKTPVKDLTMNKVLMLRKILAAGKFIDQVVTGNVPLVLSDAAAKSIVSLTRYGLCTQSSTPTPSNPVDIKCNNGTVSVRHRSGLPVRYQLLSYLRANANVDVGVKTTKNTELEAAWTRVTSTAQYLYQSDSSSSGSTNTTAYITAGGNWRFGNRTVTITPSQDKRYVSIQNSNGVSLNGEQVASYGTVGSFTSTNNLKVFGSGASLQIEYLKVRESGELVRDLVPVRDTVDGTYGFYDLVGGTFYTNANATFTPGAEADDPIEVYTVGTPEVLTVGGLNIFYNDEAWREGFYLLANGKVAKAEANRTFVMRCTPNTTYYLKHCSLVGGVRAFTVDTDTVEVGVDGTWIKQNPVVGEINEVYSVTTGATAKWLCVCFGRSHKDAAPIDDQWSDFMLSTIPLTADTPYEPYREPQTASVANLYAVGGYKDIQDIISGTVTRRVGVKVLDGAEAWIEAAVKGIFYCDMKLPSSAGYVAPAISSHFTATNKSNNSMPDCSCKLANTAKFGVALHIKYTTYEGNLADWKSYLAAQYAAGTPVIVLYPLAEATTESVAGQSLSTAAGTNTVDSVANVSPVGSEIVYKKKK